MPSSGNAAPKSQLLKYLAYTHNQVLSVNACRKYALNARLFTLQTTEQFGLSAK